MAKEASFNIENGVLTGGDFWGVTHVEIPEGVVCIGTPISYRGSGVFERKQDLVSVVIPEGVEEIGDQTFSGCSGLKEIRLPVTLKKIGQDAFKGCTSLKTVTIPEGITEISNSAFSECSGLENIEFPASLKSIGDWAFAGCKMLDNVILPEGLNVVGRSAFFRCANLSRISGITGSVSLGDSAFNACPGLADESGFICFNSMLFGYHGSQIEVKIPDGIRYISGSAFYNRSDITSVWIPEEVKTIARYAFYGCSAITEIHFPSGLQVIEESAFAHCKNLVSVILPNSVNKLGSSVFSDCNALTTLQLSAGLKEIPWRAFCDCSELKAVVIPDSVIEIGDWAFSKCVNLSDVCLSANLKKISDRAFGDCTALEKVKIPDSVENLHGFGGCTNLTVVNLPSSLKSAHGTAFEGCKKITYLRMPAGVSKGWGPYPKEILVIMEEVFSNLAEFSKSDLNCGSSLLITSGDPANDGFRMILNNKFEALKIFDKKGVLSWKIYDNVLSGNECKLPSPLVTFAMLCRLHWPVELEEDKKELYKENVIKNVKKVAPYANLIPDDGLISFLEEIGAITARNKKTLLPLMGIGEAPAPKKKAEKEAAEDGVKTPAQLKKEWNFKKLEDGTLRLTSYKGSDTVIEVPAMIGKDPVTAIGNECMTCSTWSRATTEQVAKRKKITSVVVPEGIIEIGENAFYECESLESITLPNSLKIIGPHAFLRCAKIKNLKLPDEIIVGDGAFSGCNALADENGFLIVGGTLFRCLRGGDVVVPETVKKINTYAFSGLPDLKSIVFPEGLKSLPRNTVNDCKNLEVVTIPPSVTGINEYALPDRMKLRVKGYTGSYAEQLCKNSWGRLTFESIGVLENNETGFDISDGILTRYTGKDKHIIIPDGVKKISGYTINSWRVKGAFSEKNVIESVTIPDGVESITDGAFQDCKNLHELKIPSSVIETSRFSFMGTPWFENQKGASVYAGSVLIRFNEPEVEEFAVREGTVSIGDSAFADGDWSNRVTYPLLKKVILPKGIKRIGSSAFSSCCNLEELCIPSSLTYLDEYALSGLTSLKRCYGGVLHKTEKLPARFKALYTGEPDDTAWLALYQPDKTWAKAVREKLDAAPELITPSIAKMAEIINGMETLEKSVGNRAGAFAQELCRGAEAEALMALYQALKEKGHPIVKKLDTDEVFKTCLEGGVKEDLAALHPIEALVVQNLKYTPAFEKVLGRIVEGVPYAGTEEVCAPRVLAFIAYEYIRQYDPESVKYVSMYATACTAYKFSDTADEAAASLDTQKLQEALLQLAEQYEGEYWLPYARYADDRNTVALLSKMREWDTWYKYAAIGRKHIIIARSGLLLNDTKAAMIHMDKVGCLGLYASLRNTDADTIRDTVLADFGFDENREIRYDLGGNVVVVRMDTDLNLTIFDTNAGKIVKSIPKKGADAELHEKAKTAFSDLKKNIKKVITNRKHLLFADFLSGTVKNSDKWKQSYMDNPVLNSIARLVVWTQGENTFTLTPDGAVNCNGQEYIITDEPIGVAHPIEIRSEIAAWQNYFTSNGLKQPFEQIWEPAYDPAKIQEDRYQDCRLNVYRLANKTQHGIRVWGLDSYSEEYGFELTDCEMTQDASEWRFIHGITDDATFGLGKFTFKKYTRYVNHIVYMFDKWTITDRLLKDDVTVENMLDAFTPAQLREFIHLTTEKGCVNCSAMLLNYQGAHFENLDPLAEFTLDL